jgi:hypothetical protein
MLGGKQVWKSPMSSLPCCLLLPHQKPHSFCRKLLNFGVVGTRDGDFDNFFVLFQESTKCLRSGEFGGEAGLVLVRGCRGLVGMLVSVSAPLAKSKSCLFDTQNLEQSNLLS